MRLARRLEDGVEAVLRKPKSVYRCMLCLKFVSAIRGEHHTAARSRISLQASRLGGNSKEGNLELLFSISSLKRLFGRRLASTFHSKDIQ
jgi:hypothetical protein